MEQTERKPSYSSLGNALKMLKCFTMDEPELNITELAGKLGVGMSTAHRLASTLVIEGFLSKDPNTKMYRPGVSILSLGNIVDMQIDRFHSYTPILETLMEQTSETVHLGVLRSDSIVYLHKIESNHPIRLHSHKGQFIPVHCTSSGKVFLAYLPMQEVERIVAKGLPRYTSKTVTTRKDLMRQIELTRSQGFAVSEEEFLEGVISIAAPIFNRFGKVVAALNIAGPSKRLRGIAMPRLQKLVVESARQISARLQHDQRSNAQAASRLVQSKKEP